MIYQIYGEKNLVVETDSLDYLNKVVRAHPDCSIRELGSDKVYRPGIVAKDSPAVPKSA